MFKFLHAADIHLDSPLRGLERYEGAPVDEIRLATRRAFENLVRLAIEERVAFVLVAGDLYDGDWEDCNTGHFFTRQVTKLHDAGIPLLLIRGNHDAENVMTRTLKPPEGVTPFPTDKVGRRELAEFGVVVHGRGFANRDVRDDLSLEYRPAERSSFNIGLLHTSATGRPDHDKYAPCTLEGLLGKEYDYWALGHIHQRECLDDPAAQRGRIWFPGNIQGRTIKETGPKGCLLVSVDDRRNVTTEFRPLDVMRWAVCEVTAKDCDTSDDVLSVFSSQLQSLLDSSDGLPLAVRVKIEGQCRAHERIAGRPEQCVHEIRSTAIQESSGRVWVEKVELRTSGPRDLDDGDLADGPLGELRQYIDELRGDDSRLHELSNLLGDLRKKLPTDLFKEDRNGVLGDAWLGNVLKEVEPLLVGRLLSGSGSTRC